MERAGPGLTSSKVGIVSSPARVISNGSGSRSANIHLHSSKMISSQPAIIDEEATDSSPRRLRPHLESQFSSEDSDNDQVNEEMNQIFEMQMFHEKQQQKQQISKLKSLTIDTSREIENNNTNHHHHHHHHRMQGETPKVIKMSGQLRRTPGANSMHRSAFQQHKSHNSTATTLRSSQVQTQKMNTPLLRRTPGASAMHKSRTFPDQSKQGQHHHQQPGLVMQTPTTEQLSTKQRESLRSNSTHDAANAMEFGLTLSTPVARRPQSNSHENNNHSNNNNTKKVAIASSTATPTSSQQQRQQLSINTRTPRFHHQTPGSAGRSITSTVESNTNHNDNSNNQDNNDKLKPPLPKNMGGVRCAYLYTPAGVSLAKNKNLNLRTPGNGTFSPNTCQLAAAIDDLLDDNDEEEMSDNHIHHQEQQHQQYQNEMFTNHGNHGGLSSSVIISSSSSNKKESSLPPLQKSSSFGAESNISAASSTLSFEDYLESFTLDTSKEYKNRSLVLGIDSNRSQSDATTNNSSSNNSNNFEVPLRPKFVHNSFHSSFRLDNSYNSDVSSANNSSSNDAESRQTTTTNNKSINSIKRQVNFNSLPTASGAFSPHRQRSNNNSFDNNTETLIHVPTPKKVCPPSSRGHTRQSQHGRNDDQIGGGLETEHSRQTILHHQHHHPHQNVIPPQYVETNQYDVGCSLGYDANGEIYQYPLHPMHQAIQYQNQIPMMSNAHMDYLSHMPHLPPHHTISPVTVPPSMSPLTIPSYPTNVHYECPSPVQFAPQSSNLGWSEQHVNQWGVNILDGNAGGWEQHHSQNQEFTFNGPGFFARTLNHHHTAPSPTPPQLLPYAVPNQVLGGAGVYHTNSNDQTYHGQDVRTNMQESRHHERFQPALRQGMRNKKRNDKFDKEVHTKENRKLLLNSQRQERFDGTTTDIRRGARSKQLKKNGKAIKEKSDEICGRAKKVNSKKKTLSDIQSRRKKENQSQSRTTNPSCLNSKEIKKVKDNDSNRELTPEEETAKIKRSELIETPATRAIFKDFYRQYRIKEKISLDAAAKFASDCLHDEAFPTSVHWRIYLELADIAKRANNFKKARELFNQVCAVQPYASQGWLEYSKLEEECGKLSECSRILNKGLEFCPNNEHLLIRAIKHEERLAHEEGNSDLSRARKLLAPLKHCGIEKVWRVVLEGALMEARAGYENEARRILKYLMHWIPWYGPLYLEAFRLERDSEQPIDALNIVERGLKEIPRYGPLWFGAFRLCEGLDVESNELHLPKTMEMINRATECISRELLWKVHLEAAQAQERGAHLAAKNDQTVSLSDRLSASRKRFVMTIGVCPNNLRWKVWLAAGRMELSSGRFEEARRIFQKSYSVVPVKGRPAVLLECARLEEFVGDTQLAKAILCKSRSEEGSDWKVWLQSVSVEIRNGNRREAIKLALSGLKFHSGTGRLWAAFVQLREKDGKNAQMTALSQALQAVPKSGEVWCEASRIFLNPFSVQFDLETAMRHLEFATKFTPQYGDSFIETLRLQLLKRFLLPLCKQFLDKLKSSLTKCLNKDDDNGVSSDDNLHFKFIQELRVCLFETIKSMKSQDFILNKDNALVSELSTVDTTKLELHCSNADPNYGKLWFNCRCRPSDTARTVMKRAKHIIGHNLGRYGYLYVASNMRRVAINMLTTHKLNRKHHINGNQNIKILEEKEREKWIVTIPSLQSLLLCEGEYMTDTASLKNDKNESGNDIVLLERGISSSNFTTGIYELNENVDLHELSLMERRKILFGSDLLL